MIITKQKPAEKLLESLKPYQKVFLVGCGECSTTCKTGGTDELLLAKKMLEDAGKIVSGSCIPSAPCIAAKTKVEFAKNIKALKKSQVILVFSCGLGVQSVKDNDRFSLAVLPGCDTICGAVVSAQGDFNEKCSMCGECVLDITAGICPVTLCAKGLLNGPCGGTNKGKCEVDKDRDCAWVLIYKELENKGSLSKISAIQSPRDHKKSAKPHKITVG